MKLTKIIIDVKNQKYPVIIGKNILYKTNTFLKDINFKGIKIAIITDTKIPNKIVGKVKLSLKKYDLHIFKLPPGEKTKNFKRVNYLIGEILKRKFNRSDGIIALGGGVIGDLSGLVASLVKRGIVFINIPTTLLAQVDASIGGKTAVNSHYGKNLIGSFYQPSLVLSDTSTVNSLPYREMVCGYAEILKHSLILDKKFFSWLTINGSKIIKNRNPFYLEKAISKSCHIKATIVRKDEKEKNLRMILNFGHTFAHAFEGVSLFSKKINHGEAVLLGMVMANKIALSKKMFKLNDFKKIQDHYLKLNLPYDLKKFFKKKDVIKMVNFMKSDKKNFNKSIRLILLNKIGHVAKIKEFSDNQINKFLETQFN